jgi:deferrochelatase/peroxidase EfeB
MLLIVATLEPENHSSICETQHLVLVPDPYRKGYSGSYLVFRKLEQRVRDFKEYEQKLAKALDLPRRLSEN